MKQLIIVRKDLNMSKGKMSAQVSHASIAFLLDMIKENTKPILVNDIMPCYQKDLKGNVSKQLYLHPDLSELAEKARQEGKNEFYCHNDKGNVIKDNGPIYKDYSCRMTIDEKLYKEWITGSEVKVICEAKNKNQLLKALNLAKELNIKAYPIYDECRTELQPEEKNGTCLTCIGFKPDEDEKVNLLSKKYQLFKG